MQANKTTKQRSESFYVGALLALVGGFLDAYTYLSRDGVFANAQTGNMVLLGIRLSEGRFLDALHYVFPILAFAAGVLLAELIQSAYKQSHSFHWRQLVLIIELVLLIAIGFVPDGALNPYVNIAVSFVCAMQVESFRTMHSLSYASTMCTGNLRSGTELFFHYLKSRDLRSLINSVKYYGIIVIFILGAAIGMLSTNAFAERAIWIPSALVLFVLVVLNDASSKKQYSKQKKANEEASL